MAEDIIVGGVGEIVNRLISLGLDEIGLLVGVKREVRNLQGVLNNIQAVMQDAEKKQVEQETLRVWLKDLKQVGYDAEDVLDELAYEELRRKIINYKGCNSLFSYANRLSVRFKIAHKIEDINKTIGAIDKRKNMFGLEPNQNDLYTSNQMLINVRETSSFVDDSTIVGRDSDKEKIVDMLTNDRLTSDNLSVIPIVGLGGLGKTTLAQLVYGDDDVKKHFELRVWICVSNDFDTANLFTQILEQILTNSSGSESSSIQVLLNKLEGQLKGKKFLLVLDDLWNEDQEKWDDFALPLKKFGAAGSKIIITSRSHIVASAVGAQDTYKLQMLSDDSCWALFERRAFMPGGAKKTSNLIEIGKEIAKKCKGVPLAAKVLGGLMHTKKEEREWLAAKNGDIGNTTFDEENKIMKVLKLSYDSLLPALKSCFTYCAIFPKDHWISRELLIQLWMAQGLLGASRTRGKLVMEDVGNAYFNILYSRSFFQEAETNKFGDVTECKMHDLVHDLALSVCESEYQAVGETNKMKVNLSNCRHATLMSSTTVEALNEAKKARTIFSIRGTQMVSNSATFFNFKLLRVLDLSGIIASDFPSSFCKLKHLRYLDLSESLVTSLPKWVSSLYNSFTQVLESATSGWSSRGVNNKQPEFSHICHQSIANCEDLMFLSEDLLQKNEQLKILRIYSCPKLQAFLHSNSELNDHDEVKETMIANSSLQGLVIYGCSALTSIPDVRGWTSLRHIHFGDVSSISVLVEFAMNNSLSFLTELEVINIGELTSLPAELLRGLNSLRHLQIKYCPKFQGFHLEEEGETAMITSGVEMLSIHDCPAITSMDLGSFVSLRELFVTKCVGLELLQGLQFLTSLENMSLGPFSEKLDYFPLPIDADSDDNPLTSLGTLLIYGWPTLQALPHQLRLLTSLKYLVIEHFDGLTVLPEWLDSSTFQGKDAMPYLTPGAQHYPFPQIERKMQQRWSGVAEDITHSTYIHIAAKASHGSHLTSGLSSIFRRDLRSNFHFVSESVFILQEETSKKASTVAFFGSYFPSDLIR